MPQLREFRVADHIDSIRELLAMNWAETGFDFELKPNVALYQEMQDRGLLVVIGAFDGDTIVGYSTAVVSPHAFNPEVLTAATDALFVHPDYRKGLTAARLVYATEEESKRRGAQFIVWHTRAGTSFAKMLEKRGYEPADVCVVRRL